MTPRMTPRMTPLGFSEATIRDWESKKNRVGLSKDSSLERASPLLLGALELESRSPSRRSWQGGRARSFGVGSKMT